MYKQACLIFKSKTDRAPSYIQDLFTNVTDCYSLRSSAQNSIPNDIRYAESSSQLKVG